MKMAPDFAASNHPDKRWTDTELQSYSFRHFSGAAYLQNSAFGQLAMAMAGPIGDFVKSSSVSKVFGLRAPADIISSVVCFDAVQMHCLLPVGRWTAKRLSNETVDVVVTLLFSCVAYIHDLVSSSMLARGKYFCWSKPHLIAKADVAPNRSNATKATDFVEFRNCYPALFHVWGCITVIGWGTEHCYGSHYP